MLAATDFALRHASSKQRVAGGDLGAVAAQQCRRHTQRLHRRRLAAAGVCMAGRALAAHRRTAGTGSTRRLWPRRTPSGATGKAERLSGRFLVSPRRRRLPRPSSPRARVKKRNARREHAPTSDAQALGGEASVSGAHAAAAANVVAACFRVSAAWGEATARGAHTAALSASAQAHAVGARGSRRGAPAARAHRRGTTQRRTLRQRLNRACHCGCHRAAPRRLSATTRPRRAKR